LRRLIGTTVTVQEQLAILDKFCVFPGWDAPAAVLRVALDANMYRINQQIGAPRQTLAVDDLRPEDSPWAAQMKEIARDLDAIEGESRVLNEGADMPSVAPDETGTQTPTITEAEDGSEPT